MLSERNEIDEASQPVGVEAHFETVSKEEILMNTREGNRKIRIVFMLCAAAVAVVAWTIQEKFITNAIVALIVNVVAALCIALVFARYMDSKLNRSVDFLMRKIARVGQGDMTQVFKEDPDDMLPYGLSFELGEMMKGLRESIGGLWRTSSLLVRQLHQFIGSSQEVMEEFRKEVKALSHIGETLQSVRDDTLAMVRQLSELRVNSDSDVVVTAQANAHYNECGQEIDRTKELIKRITERLAGLRDAVGHVESTLGSFADLATSAQEIRKTMRELSTEAGLVKLNAAIDATQEENAGENYEKLIKETKTIVDKIGELAVRTGGAFTATSDRVVAMAQEIRDRQADLNGGIENGRKILLVLDSVSDRTMAARSSSVLVREHAEALNTMLAGIDDTVSDFNVRVKDSEDEFDKLFSDASTTLLKFDDLGNRIESIQDNLKHMEEINKKFSIA